jgi:DNA-binding NarL/FixJ family response regulator
LPKEVVDRLNEGAQAYVGKNVVVSYVQMNEIYLLRGRAKVAADTLSEREFEIAHQVSEGHDYKTIALALNVSPATVRTHVNNIFVKLGINDKARLGAELGRMS